jgi:hypothetical protein
VVADGDRHSFDAAILRTTWDYQKDPKAFLQVLAAIDRSTRLENSLRLVRQPSLYLRMDAAAPARFARTLDTWMQAER